MTTVYSPRGSVFGISGLTSPVFPDPQFRISWSDRWQSLPGGFQKPPEHLRALILNDTGFHNRLMYGGSPYPLPETCAVDHPCAAENPEM